MADTPPHDLLIRGGLLIDGSGAAPTHGDLAIRDGRIAAIGADLGDAAGKVIDADGLAVAPASSIRRSTCPAKTAGRKPYCLSR